MSEKRDFTAKRPRGVICRGAQPWPIWSRLEAADIHDQVAREAAAEGAAPIWDVLQAARNAPTDSSVVGEPEAEVVSARKVKPRATKERKSKVGRERAFQRQAGRV